MNLTKWKRIFKRIFNVEIKLKRILILLVLWVLLYGEVICFYVDRFFWSNLQCDSDKTDCPRILLVADPQIIGENDGDWYTNGIRIWDSDRYLYYSYQHAVEYFKPDVIVFLGDLMDEGSQSTLKQYLGYLKRFRDIFNTNYPVQFIYIPGDNDIGGEFGDWITPEKIFRFEHILSGNQSQRIEYNDEITFFKVNRLVQEYRHITSDNEDSPKIRVVLSHMPLTNIGFVDVLVKKINPNVIFAAHNHVPYIIEYDHTTDNKDYAKVVLNHNQIYTADFHSDITYEYVVPTCSYRMGVPNMGYGAAVLDSENGKLKYTIFWIHSRLSLLWLYLWMLVGVITICLLVYILCPLIQCSLAILRRCRKTKKDYVVLIQNVC